MLTISNTHLNTFLAALPPPNFEEGVLFNEKQKLIAPSCHFPMGIYHSDERSLKATWAARSYALTLEMPWEEVEIDSILGDLKGEYWQLFILKEHFKAHVPMEGLIPSPQQEELQKVNIQNLVNPPVFSFCNSTDPVRLTPKLFRGTAHFLSLFPAFNLLLARSGKSDGMPIITWTASKGRTKIHLTLSGVTLQNPEDL